MTNSDAEDFAAAFDDRYPMIARFWRNRWEHITALLALPSA